MGRATRTRAQDRLEEQEALDDVALMRASENALESISGPDQDLEDLDIPEDELDADLTEANDPDVRPLSEPPLLGTAPSPSDIFGSTASNVGTSSSPLLYSQISNFPTAVQFRVWRWENGLPVAIGAIDCNATEDDFIEEFFQSMPKPGDRRFQFRLRPIDQRARELGKEITLNISETHTTLKRLREKEKREKEDMNGGRGDVFLQGNDPGTAGMAEEMGRMFEHTLSAAEERTRLLQESLAEERERLRLEERARVEERIRQAENAGTVVEKLTDRLMSTDQARSKEAIEAQRASSDMMVNTLTTVFSNQSSAAREMAERQAKMQAEAAERQRAADDHRLQQDREFFERQRQELELRRQYEKEEADRKRQEERDRLQAETERREKEMEMKMERERLEIERKREQDREERERWRVELEEKRRNETMEWDRKQALAREEAERKRLQEQEDRDRRAREDMARWEREKLEMQERIASERLLFEKRREEERAETERRAQVMRDEAERRDRLLREEAAERENRRKEELALQLRQMDTAMQRDREHAERMAEAARQEREAAREAANREREREREMLMQREKAEREDREFREAERQRKHDLMVREMEINRERDREHAERMLQLSKAQTSGLGGLTEMLGMKTPELLERIFGGGGDMEEGDGGGGSIWEKLPGMIESLAGLGKAALSKPSPPRFAQAPAPPALPQPYPFQPSQAVSPAPRQPVPVQQAPVDVRSEPAPRPERVVRKEPEVSPVPAETSADPEYEAASKLDFMALAKKAEIPMAEQRKARKAIRDLVTQLEPIADDPEKAEAAIMAAAMKTPQALNYIQAVSVYGVLAEAKASPELTLKIVAALRAHPMIPSDFPFTTADLSREKAEEVSPAPPVEAAIPVPTPVAAGLHVKGETPPGAGLPPAPVVATEPPPSWPDPKTKKVTS